MEGSSEWTRAQKLKCLLSLIIVALVIQISYISTKLYLYQRAYLPGRFVDRNPLALHDLTYGDRIRQNFGELLQWMVPEGDSTTISPAQILIQDRAMDNRPAVNDTSHICPLVPPSLVGPLAVNFIPHPFLELEAIHSNLSPGGSWRPRDCTARHRVAIIIPYRNREAQLRVLLHHLHPFLQRQQLDYAIFVVDQALPSTFNRAILMNIGYAISTKLYPFDCFVFHDVDLLPENDRNLYTCPQQPRHLSVAIDKFNYKLPYEGIFGGATVLTREHMRKTNGFSNLYFGWGGEDDDMRKRIDAEGLKVIRYGLDVARYKMIKHLHESSNKANPQRFALLRTARFRYKTDGINSLVYDILRIEQRKLYTWVYVRVDEAKVAKTQKQPGIFT